jgi:hypothetical protein
MNADETENSYPCSSAFIRGQNTFLLRRPRREESIVCEIECQRNIDDRIGPPGLPDLSNRGARQA